MTTQELLFAIAKRQGIFAPGYNFNPPKGWGRLSFEDRLRRIEKLLGLD